MYNLEQLLAPISAQRPSGEDLSFSAELNAIAQARKFDDPSLDQGEWITELKEADWNFVAERCAALLAGRSKDLRLAAWLTEAWARRHQLRGLGEGYRLLAGLLSDFWESGLHPEPDGGDYEQRIGNLSWILARTPDLVKAMPVTDGNAGTYSTIDFDAARQAAGNRNGGTGMGGQLAVLEAARRNTSPQFCGRFAADAAFCMDAFNQLERAANTRLGIDSPGFSSAREALCEVANAVPAPARIDTAAVQAGSIDDGTAATVAGSAVAIRASQASPSTGLAGPPGSRSQALAQLRVVAEFFRLTEPHSPVSYFADKAADAGEQSLHTWLRGVVKDPVSLAHIEELLGVPAGPAGQQAQ
jgi:type VI secretion system protein ImpA